MKATMRGDEKLGIDTGMWVFQRCRGGYLEVSAGHGDVLEQHRLAVVEVVLGVVLAAAYAAESIDLHTNRTKERRKSG